MSFSHSLSTATGHGQMIDLLNQYFESHAQRQLTTTAADTAVAIITEHHGMIRVSAVLQLLRISERRLEYLFRAHVGLSPKLFARILRFNYIFSLVKESEQDWAEIVYRAAFFDQSHFIRNFREFTGESPSEYAFREKNMANFFLQPPPAKRAV